MRAFSDIRRSVMFTGVGVAIGALAFGGAWALAAGGTSVGGGTKVSSLPSCAAGNDGQTVFYQNATMASSGLVWRLRCNAGSSSAYKWEFVGGSSMRSGPHGGNSWYGGDGTNSTNFVTHGTQTAVQVPLAGEYEADARSNMYVNGPHLGAIYIRQTSNTSGVGWSSGDAVGYTSGGSVGNSLAARKTLTVATNETIRMEVAISNASFWAYHYNRMLYVTPIRVG